MDTILKYMSDKLAEYSDYDSEVIAFSMKLWIASIFQSLVMIAIAYVAFDVKYFFYFFVAFFPLRLLIEGYHSKSFIGCFIVSTAMFIGICLLADLTMTLMALKIVLFVLFVISTVGLMIKSFIKSEKTKFYLFIRLGYISLISLFVVINIIQSGINCSVHIWVSIISFSAVFILNLLRRL